MDDDIRQFLRESHLREAFDLVVERYRDKVFRLAMTFVRNETAAEDLAQDILVRVWKGLPGFHGEASLSTWIYTIARNTCLTEVKRRSAHPTVSLDAGLGDDPDGPSLELAAPATEESAGRLDVPALLDQLSPRYRQVLMLFYFEQKGYEEVATMLGIPLGTVKTLIFRARKELMRLASRPALAQLAT